MSMITPCLWFDSEAEEAAREAKASGVRLVITRTGQVLDAGPRGLAGYDEPSASRNSTSSSFTSSARSCWGRWRFASSPGRPDGRDLRAVRRHVERARRLVGVSGSPAVGSKRTWRDGLSNVHGTAPA